MLTEELQKPSHSCQIGSYSLLDSELNKILFEHSVLPKHFLKKYLNKTLYHSVVKQFTITFTPTT